MRAIRLHQYGGPEQIKLEEVPIPQINEDQILVKVCAASVNPIDFKLASGTLRPIMNNKPVDLPWTPGWDFSGIIEKTGSKVKNFKKGDAVFGHSPGGGSFAEFVVAHSNCIAFKPKKLSHVEAASVPVAAQTALQALFDCGHLLRGQTVLIQGGSGGVGTFAIQLSKWKKAKVLATALSEDAQFLQELGADAVIDYKSSEFESAIIPNQIDFVLDLVGQDTQERSFKVLKMGGQLVSTVHEPAQDLMTKYKVRASMMVMKPSVENLVRFAELLDTQKIKTCVTKTYPLSETTEAWKNILSNHTLGKTVVEISNGRY
jgi:NADPH:quinone reductase-like Zn-dependent oxidoreductase